MTLPAAESRSTKLEGKSMMPVFKSARKSPSSRSPRVAWKLDPLETVALTLGKKTSAASPAVRGLSSVPSILPRLELKLVKLKFMTVCRLEKGTGVPPKPEKAMPDKLPLSVPVSPVFGRLSVPALKVAAVGTKSAVLVLPTEVSRRSRLMPMSNSSTLPALVAPVFPAVGTKKAACPETLPPVTGTWASTEGAIATAKLPAKLKQTKYCADLATIF